MSEDSQRSDNAHATLNDALLIIAAARIAGSPHRGFLGWLRNRKFDSTLAQLRHTSELFDQAEF